MIMFDYAFVDLDHTIYNTDLFMRDMWGVAEKMDISWKDYEKTFVESLHSVSQMQYDYSFEEHLDLLEKNGYRLGKVFLDKMNALTKNNYLFSDSEDFIIFLKSVSKKVILLSAGDKKFQMSKIYGSGVDKFFDEVSIAEIPKIEFFRQNFSEYTDNSLFINDNLKENKKFKEEFPELNIVVKFNDKRYTEVETKESGLPYFKTLEEIKNYVLKLG